MEDRSRTEEIDEEYEAEWDRMFNDPTKVANFERWAEGRIGQIRRTGA